jgi:FixJ family two-component response regulator
MSHSAPVVFVVSDDGTTRQALEVLIRAKGWNARTFPSAEAFLGHPVVAVPSCLLLDATHRDVDWLQVQRRAATRRSQTLIIFLSRYVDLPMAVQAIKAGALEFFTIPFRDDALVTAIGDAVERSRLSLEQSAKMKALQDAYESLSRREREVMGLVACGYLNKQVGWELGISEITVKAHRGKVMRKMRAGSLADLVRMAAGLHLPATQWMSGTGSNGHSGLHSLTSSTTLPRTCRPRSASAAAANWVQELRQPT